MHILIWMKNALTLQEIRDKIMDPNSDFQQAMVEYLESVHMGEFMTGSMESVKQNIKIHPGSHPQRHCQSHHPRSATTLPNQTVSSVRSIHPGGPDSSRQ